MLFLRFLEFPRFAVEDILLIEFHKCIVLQSGL